MTEIGTIFGPTTSIKGDMGDYRIRGARDRLGERYNVGISVSEIPAGISLETLATFDNGGVET